MSSLPGLSGFYFDDTKRKYFRITSSQNIPEASAQAAYTKEALEKKEKEKLEKLKQDQELVKSGRLVKKNKLLQSVAREIGNVPSTWAHDYRNQSYVSHWTFSKLVGNDVRRSNFDCFTFDVEKKKLFTCKMGNNVVSYGQLDAAATVVDGNDTYGTQQVVLDTREKRITDMVYQPGLGNILCLMNSEGGSHIARINRTAGLHSRVHLHGQNRMFYGRALAAAPAVSWAAAYVALDGGVGAVRKDGKFVLIHMDYMSQHYPLPETMAVAAFPQRSSNSILSGYRKGKVRQIDMTIGNSDSRRPTSVTVQTLARHPSSVAHIKPIDSNRILVAGLSSTMAQYDLRYLKRQHTARSWAQNKDYRNMESTIPVVQYAEYVNESRFNLGLDLDVETGIIAAASSKKNDEFNDYIKIFSLHTGQILRNLITPATQPSTPTTRLRDVTGCISSVEFVDDTDGRWSKSLFYRQDHLIGRWSL